MQLNFEQQKNLKASIYTALICVILSFVFVVLQWQKTPPTITPPEPQFMEVNLGNSETGLGETPPLSKEAPSLDEGQISNKVATTIPEAEKINTSSDDPTDELVKTSKEKVVSKNTIAPPKPVKVEKAKAVMGKYQGGNGKGGNNQDSYNGVKDQGIAGGKGDQGAANGKIDGKSYTGKGGPFVTKGDRKIVKVYSFNGDVEAATIYAEIEVSPSGAGKFIQIAKGSSSNDAKYKSAIREYLNKISFNVSDHSSVVTVKFKFEVQ
jgi:hypothetical protein